MQYTKPDFLYSTATGIGSMPHTELSDALQLIYQTIPQTPHWPQLPTLGREEGFARQYLHALEKLELLDTKGETPFFYNLEKDWTARLERFYQLCLQAEDEETLGEVLPRFAFPPEAAGGFYALLSEPWVSQTEPCSYIKGQISGPLSLGLQINGGDGAPAFYNPELREVITRTLALIARWQVRALGAVSCPVLIFIDEPALLSYGQSTFVSLSRDAIKESLAEIIKAISEENGFAGVHCCSGVDWSLLFELPLQVVNFDAYSYFSSLLVYTEGMESFLRRGGCLGWGLIPTSAHVEKEHVETLLDLFNEAVERLVNKGVTKELLREQYLLTPACGAATLSITQAERVYRLLAELRDRMAKR